jgi:hypothetical protein
MCVIFSGLSFIHPFAHKGRSELIPFEKNRRGSLRYQSQHKYSHPHGRNKVLIRSVAEFLTVSPHTLTVCRLGAIARGSKMFTKNFFYRIINVVESLYAHINQEC